MATPLDAASGRWAGMIGLTVMLTGVALLVFHAGLGIVMIPAGLVLTLASMPRRA